jgi:hypothetical protein
MKMDKEYIIEDISHHLEELGQLGKFVHNCNESYDSSAFRDILEQIETQMDELDRLVEQAWIVA